MTEQPANRPEVQFYDIDLTADTVVSPVDGLEFFYLAADGGLICGVRFNDSAHRRTVLLLTPSAAELVARGLAAMVTNVDAARLEADYRGITEEDQ